RVHSPQSPTTSSGPLSLHGALPISSRARKEHTAVEKKTTEPTSESRATWDGLEVLMRERIQMWLQDLLEEEVSELLGRSKSERRDRKSTRLNSSHGSISYAVFCLKK